jgi:hypothetical protein
MGFGSTSGGGGYSSVREEGATRRGQDGMAGSG